TGNFGDVLAGYYAKHMGLPIDNLVVATNSNDILDRFFKTGRYEKINNNIDDNSSVYVYQTLSPAMDITISSNFERLLWYLAYENLKDEKKDEGEKIDIACSTVNDWMKRVKLNQNLIVDKSILDIALDDFKSSKVTDEEVLI